MSTTLEPGATSQGAAAVAAAPDAVRDSVVVVQSSNFWDLCFQLLLRDIKARYKQTLFGALWGLGRPLLELAVYVVVFGNVLNAPSDDTPYPLFAYAGIVMWTFVAGAIPRATDSLVSHSGLVSSIPFPKATIPLAAVGAALFDAAVAATLLALAIAYYQAPLTIHVLWLIPIGMLLIGFVLGLAFVFATLNVFYRDFRHLVEMGIRILLFLTPVVYASSAVPERFETWYRLNPLVGIFENVRRVLIMGTAPDWATLVYPAAFTLIALPAALLLFKRAEPYFAETV